MSKLRDRMREMSRRRTAAFGFAVARDAERVPRQVLVIAQVDDAAAAGAAAEAGADAVLYTGAAEGFADVVTAAGSCVVGRSVAAASAADTAGIAEAGGHFLAFDDQQTDASALLKQNVGYVAIVASDDTELRLLRPLDLDGVLVASPSEQMTVREQLRLRRFGEQVRKPLIARLDHAPSATNLEVWRDAGVVAVLAPSDGDTLRAVIEAADAVPRPREANERPEVTVPTVQASGDDEDDDDF
jgi:hypothetical protein